jgi:hypothetical protein
MIPGLQGRDRHRLEWVLVERFAHARCVPLR